MKPNQAPATCVDCRFHTYRVDMSDPCSKCGGEMVPGGFPAARARDEERHRSAKRPIVGVRNPAEEADTNRRLREAREAVGG